MTTVLLCNNVRNAACAAAGAYLLLPPRDCLEKLEVHRAGEQVRGGSPRPLVTREVFVAPVDNGSRHRVSLKLDRGEDNGSWHLRIMDYGTEYLSS